ncbi:cytochrome b5-like [Artemia franciscana]|uniref:Cytochrome b5 n=1 Tax=Artemia franciscana TaxID=6661 RepID=A0AA88I8P5_ARTSF|nr:hypothetical protein QYM36_002809 [Artemia franciscana]
MVSEKVEKTFTRKEVEAHNCTKEGAWIIIHDGIYDVSKFLDEHPGGEEVLLEQAGKDGTAEFEDVGHSSDARDMMKDYKIGVLDEAERKTTAQKGPETWAAEKKENGTSWISWIVPVSLAFAASIVYRWYGSAR